MAKRLIKSHFIPDGRSILVYYNREWSEYVVQWYDHKGTHMDASDYFTSDKQDALDTAELSVKETTS